MTVNEIFEKVIPYMSEELISSEIVSLFKKLNEKFPEKITTDGLFECPLGIDAPVSDLSLSVCDTGREIIAGKREGFEINKALLKSPVWRRIRSFCENWFHQEIYNNKGNMWFEFDLESLRKEIPIPGIFFYGHISPEKNFLSHKINRYKWIIDGLECLRGKPLKKEIKDNLMYCLDGLSEKGRLDYGALMLSRPIDAVRVVICIPEEDLKDYLALIKHPGDHRELLALVAELSQFTNLRYNIDISHKVLPKVGIECFLKDKKKAHKEKWDTFLNHLIERSLCIRKKKDALMDWLGYEYVTLPEDSEPYYIFRRISHIKIVYEKGEPFLAKAYPEFFKSLEIDLLFNKILESCKNQ